MLKDLLKELKEAEKKTAELDAAWDAAPEDENIIAAWDESYQNEYRIHDEIAKYIMKLTNVSRATANAMITLHRAKLESIAKKEV